MDTNLPFATQPPSNATQLRGGITLNVRQENISRFESLITPQTTMKIMTFTDSTPTSLKINLHARTLIELLVISILCVIIFNLRTQLKTQEYVQKGELFAKELTATRLFLELATPVTELPGVIPVKDLSPEPEKNLLPSERRALELSVPKGSWTE